MMDEALIEVAQLPAIHTLLLAALTGTMLGFAFFAGLWWTTQRAANSSQPALWLLSSLLVRMSLTIGGFYLVAAGHWASLLLCLAGFVSARVIIMRLLPAEARRAP